MDQKTFVKLMELGIRECGWLPFQKNIRNDDTGMYDEYSTSMNEFSDFMIGFSNLNNDTHTHTHTDDGCVFLIGNEIFINSMNINGTSMSNTGAQTVRKTYLDLKDAKKLLIRHCTLQQVILVECKEKLQITF